MIVTLASSRNGSMVAPWALVRRSENVSSGSDSSSVLVRTDTFLEISPGSNVTLPLPPK